MARHTFEHYASLQGAFHHKQLPFDETVAQLVKRLLMRHKR